MGSSGDLLENLPKELLSKLDKPLEDEPKPVVAKKEPHQSPAAPKPRPRAAPRKKPMPTPGQAAGMEEEGKRPVPQAAPRTRTQTNSTSETSRPAAEEKGEPPVVENETGKANESPKHPPVKASPPTTNPKPAARPPLTGPKPPAKRDSGIGKPPAKDPPVEHSSPAREPHLPTTRNHGSPNRSRTNSAAEKEGAPEIVPKDPSKLSVKEKALLAQKVLLGTPEKQKPGPPVPRKPKPGSAATTPVVTNPSISEDTPTSSSMSPEEKRMKRAQSMDDNIGGGSPQQSRRKLPPGAFNMMGGVPMLGGRAERSRCATVSTSEFDDHDRNSLERHVSPEELRNANSREEATEQDQTDGLASERTQPSPSATPPTPGKLRHGESAESSVPMATTPEEAGVDCEVVLTWTPDVTAAWLSQIGLGEHQQVFIEKGIQGYMLFDIDGHKLKVSSKKL